MAAQCKVAPRHLATRLKALSLMLSWLLRDARAALEAQGVPAHVLARLEDRLQGRCEKVSSRADDIAHVPKDLP